MYQLGSRCLRSRHDPQPSCFDAAGIVDAPLVPLIAAFFAGVSYPGYVTAASAAEATLGTILQSAFTSPLGITLKPLMVAGLVAPVRIDWTRILTDQAPTIVAPATPIRPSAKQAQRRTQLPQSPGPAPLDAPADRSSRLPGLASFLPIRRASL